jgi:hypothetical protein
MPALSVAAWQEREGEPAVAALERHCLWLLRFGIWDFDSGTDMLKVEVLFASPERCQDWAIRLLTLARQLGVQAFLFHDWTKNVAALSLESCLEPSGRRFVAAVVDLTFELTGSAPN